MKLLSYFGIISWDTADQQLHGSVRLWNWVFDIFKNTSLMCTDVKLEIKNDGKIPNLQFPEYIKT